MQYKHSSREERIAIGFPILDGILWYVITAGTLLLAEIC